VSRARTGRLGFAPEQPSDDGTQEFLVVRFGRTNLLAKQQRAAYRDTVQTPAITSTDLGDTP
jgi:hypothetical protein